MSLSILFNLNLYKLIKYKDMKHLIIIFLIIFINVRINAQTTIQGSFVFEGLTRTYRIYIPAMYNSSVSVPLIFNLHGYGSNNTEQESYGDFRQIADTANFIIVHPNGTLDSYNKLTWNSFDLSTVNDIGFLNALIDTVKTNYNIDDNRIYCTGLSNGGFMSYDIACYLSNRITAIASVAGSMIQTHINSCIPNHPIPVMEIHGTADATVPYNGYSSFLNVDTVVKHWIQFNNCSSVPVITNLPDINTFDGCTTEHHVFSGGNNNSSVELYKIIGGGHSWPGAPININVTSMDFNASVEIWKFFNKYKLNELTNVSNHNYKESIEIYPNPSSDEFILNFQNNTEKKIIVFNSFGQIVNTYKCNSYKLEIAIKTDGIYFIEIKTNKGLEVKKIVKL